MRNPKDKFPLIKLFYEKMESAIIALHKFRFQKNMKSEIGPITLLGLTKLVLLFEETETVEDNAIRVRSSLKKDRSSLFPAEMKTLVSESLTGTSSALKTRRLHFPSSLVCRILHSILCFYWYKRKSSHEHWPTDTVQREFARWLYFKKLQDLIWFVNIL